MTTPSLIQRSATTGKLRLCVGGMFAETQVETEQTDPGEKEGAPLMDRDALAQQPATAFASSHDNDYPDLSDVKGQLQAKRALEIAAAGQDSLLILCWPRPARATDRRNTQSPARVEGAALQNRPVAAV